jgi:glutathione peroxidase
MSKTPWLLCAVAVAIALSLAWRAQKIFGQTIVHDPSTQPATQPSNLASPLQFVMKDIDGKDVNLADYRGKVVMLVNVASKCGFTPQYAGLEKLYTQYKDQGFVIIGFPANNFHSQEPGTDAEIKTFCTSKYDVTFPMMSKISVKGADKDPLYTFLTEQPTAGDFAGEIGWNFTKFLVSRDGLVYARFPSKTKPQDPIVIDAIEKGLAAKPAMQ